MQMLEKNLSSSVYGDHLQALHLQRKLQQLNTRKQELQEETQGTLNPDEIKQKILERVKEDNQIVSDTNSQINLMEEKIEQLNQLMQQKEKDLETMKSYGEQAHKYELLFERDKKK